MVLLLYDRVEVRNSTLLVAVVLVVIQCSN